jgi:hypothetical protein
MSYTRYEPCFKYLADEIDSKKPALQQETTPETDDNETENNEQQEPDVLVFFWKEVFPLACEKAFKMGARLAGNNE